MWILFTEGRYEGCVLYKTPMPMVYRWYDKNSHVSKNVPQNIMHYIELFESSAGYAGMGLGEFLRAILQ